MKLPDYSDYDKYFKEDASEDYTKNFSEFELNYEMPGKGAVDELYQKVTRANHLIATLNYVKEQPDTPDRMKVLYYLERMLDETD